jgi:uncharacterized protein (TIGR03000 family)
MLRYILTTWRPVALTALLALAAAPADVWAAGHGGGGGGGHGGGGYHGGGAHYGGYHGGGYGGGAHYGGYNVGGYRPGYFGGYHNSYGYGQRGYGYGGYYSPSLYTGAYLSGGDALPPDFYYSPNYTTAAPYSSLSAYYAPDDAAPTPAVTAPTVAPDAASGRATVDVHVPASAQVWFDDSATKQTGADRQYVSPPLTPGQNFTYDVRARWIDNGHVTDLTRTITVHANSVNSVDFTQPAPAATASK